MENNNTQIAQYLGYEAGEVSLKINAKVLINAFVFLATANPTLANAMQYAEVLEVFSSLTRVAQEELTKEELAAKEAEVVTPEVEATPADAKPSIKAEVV